MAVRTRRRDEREFKDEAETRRAEEVMPYDALLALQETAGNAAVARLIARRVVARAVDYDALADKIFNAIKGLGTDEQAIFLALEQLGRDPAEIDKVKAAYKARHNADMIADIQGDLSGDELQHALFLLRLAPSSKMAKVAGEMGSMVGQQATWVPSGPGSKNTFESWASAASEAAAPPLKTVTTINCWEMVLLAAYRAGALTWQWIHDQYTANVSDWGAYMVSMLSKGTRIPYVAGAPAGRKPLRGDIVFMNGMEHVAMATGNVDGTGRAEIFTFWPPPNTAFTHGGTVDDVKVSTIEELSDWWAANSPPAPLVELAAPVWA